MFMLHQCFQSVLHLRRFRSMFVYYPCLAYHLPYLFVHSPLFVVLEDVGSSFVFSGALLYQTVDLVLLL